MLYAPMRCGHPLQREVISTGDLMSDFKTAEHVKIEPLMLNLLVCCGTAYCCNVTYGLFDSDVELVTMCEMYRNVL